MISELGSKLAGRAYLAGRSAFNRWRSVLIPSASRNGALSLPQGFHDRLPTAALHETWTSQPSWRLSIDRREAGVLRIIHSERG
jgi:hypothetical protein